MFVFVVCMCVCVVVLFCVVLFCCFSVVPYAFCVYDCLIVLCASSLLEGGGRVYLYICG